MKYDDMPEIVEKDESEIDAIIQHIYDGTLPDDSKPFVVKCIRSSIWLAMLLMNQKITLHRFREMIFGKSRKNKKMKGNDSMEDPNALAPLSESNPKESSVNSAINNDAFTTTYSDANASTASPQTTNQEDKLPKPGHGRMAHTVYDEFTEVCLQLAYQPGDPCPATLCRGKLRDVDPGILVRIKGQSVARVYRYTVTKLRCALCNLLISAPIPASIGTEKYDAVFKAWLVIQKYFMAVPFYRQEVCQKMLGFPLPDATQWDLVEQLAGCCYAVFNLLKRLAANGDLLCNDDTRLKILDVIKRLKQAEPGERRGMYTTGIVAAHEGHPIALFLNGTLHSGENVGDVLSLRDTDKAPMIQMCDALSANVPTDVLTTLCNCLSHGFRKFVELVDFYEKPCVAIMGLLSKVFEHDAASRGMTPQARLAHHQTHSAPIMQELSKYMTALIDTRQIEPNSELGKAIKYMQRHWLKLTRFLSVAGAPIDNNIVERALKVAIRNRKSSMFYRSTYSAHIGGMLTSIIYTCHLGNQNPQDYLSALQTHQALVTANPSAWLPWNYQNTINSVTQDAKPQVHSPPAGYLAAASP